MVRMGSRDGRAASRLQQGTRDGPVFDGQAATHEHPERESTLYESGARVGTCTAVGVSRVHVPGVGATRSVS
jgi:hypothetical protein